MIGSVTSNVSVEHAKDTIALACKQSTFSDDLVATRYPAKDSYPSLNWKCDGKAIKFLY